MASFIEDLWGSVFTPGPTPTLLVATNASFAALQLILGVLLFMTKSVHFIILSFLCATLWMAINWFAGELQAAKAKEDEADRLRKERLRQESRVSSGDDTETETDTISDRAPRVSKQMEHPARAGAGDVRRRKSIGESGEVSTEDEWEKVSGDGLKDK
ncbi:MAG: hypothetical protein M1825_001737 [Sarcosagium campestre]|nr:MAG: hypothetical protein M1825_001737 [Sarcosagium campestre]